ncbi:hypothetical protein C8F01DRAFT_563389 [Mycena amicta]|nr:hypothetical protein C8F01DRAFT_691729 [Mycena amicta]KAJ7052673.1 hypothetical protein C8F01DRAFT_563389 [Mycena amicta]
MSPMDYAAIPPLDENFWETLPLAANELEFLASHTGIQDLESLKRHVIAVQMKAYDVYNYPCIQRFNFVRSNRITRLLGYRKALAVQRERPEAVLLDLGCAFGTEVRRLVVDGFPASSIVACDLHREFWDLGHELYKSTTATLPVSFIAGDILDERFFSISATEPELLPALGSLTTLTPLKGKLSVIHASALLHLFDEQTQAAIARIFASLLSPLPGSMIFGAHIGNKHGTGQYARMPYFAGFMFCHSPETWQEMWVKIFGEGVVRVEVVLNEYRTLEESTGQGDGWLNWCVTRV